MDSFGNYPRDEPFDPFSIMLFKALQVVAFLFFIALLAMNPEASTGKIDTKAEFVITMDWPDDSLDDVDLYVEDPLGNIVWYHDREEGFLVLERDDRGGANDFVTVSNKKIVSHIREEQTTIRGFVAGEYTVNCDLYLHQDAQPTQVTVKVQKINPSLVITSLDTLTLDRTGEEKTAVRFRIDDKGDVIDGSVNHNFKSLIDLTRTIRTQGQK